ncbi:polyprenyl synthetase family protein [Amycolatopsis minnesotensis]|uniref:Polyprenyl synthetase n=1 Tax=Amycolatopsis minnesotensis TaxID=337894 RepID=A0ABP5DSV4_9PSEU
MTETTDAEQRIRGLFGEIEQVMDDLVAEYTRQYGNLRSVVPAVVHDARPDRHEFSLPLLVHGAETGDPTPAVTVAAIHALWWRAANVIDDVSDGAVTGVAKEMGAGATMMAAFNWAYVVPPHALQRLPVDDELRRALAFEFFQACTAATDGQLADLFDDPGDTTREQVMQTYRNKSSAPYVMASSMAARAAGADDVRTGRWRRFGLNLGLLGQFRNDQEDLDSGRFEDLANRTPTYHLVALVNSTGGADRERVVSLLGRARTDEEAREELVERLLAPGLVRSYLRLIDRIRDDANRTLDGLNGEPSFVEALRRRVDDAATPCGLLADAAARLDGPSAGSALP